MQMITNKQYKDIMRDLANNDPWIQNGHTKYPSYWYGCGSLDQPMLHCAGSYCLHELHGGSQKYAYSLPDEYDEAMHILRLETHLWIYNAIKNKRVILGGENE